MAIQGIHTAQDTIHMNVNVFSFYDDEGRARQPIYISKKTFKKSVDLLYWDEH